MADSQGFWSLRLLVPKVPKDMSVKAGSASLGADVFAANLNCRGSPLVGSMKPCIASPASSNRDFEQSTDAVWQFPHDSGSKGRIIRNSYVTIHRDAIPSFKPWNQEPIQPRVH
jgi:hypothetical protein